MKVKINNDLASKKKLTDTERRNIELRALYNFKGVSNVADPLSDPDKVHAETKKLLNMQEEHKQQNARPSLQDLIDAERAAREKPARAVQFFPKLPREPSPDELHERTRATLQHVENLRKRESQEAMEKAEKQLAESNKLQQTVGHFGKHSPGTLPELQDHQSKQESEEQQKAFQKTIRQITSG